MLYPLASIFFYNHILWIYHHQFVSIMLMSKKQAKDLIVIEGF